MVEKTLSVPAIQEGTVIDHIIPGSALKIIRLLRLSENNRQVTVGLNLKSPSLGNKDLIKVTNFFLSPEHAEQIAIFSPNSTVNVIENYLVVKKFCVDMPKEISGTLQCPNPRCITGHEKIKSRFFVEENEEKVSLLCFFCEKSFSRNEAGEFLW